VAIGGSGEKLDGYAESASPLTVTIVPDLDVNTELTNLKQLQFTETIVH
jgi:hypothetical protein